MRCASRTATPADLVVLADDLARVPAERIRHTGVAMTIVSGQMVYEA